MNATTKPSVLMNDGFQTRKALIQIQDRLDSLTAGEFIDLECRKAIHQAWFEVEKARLEVDRRLKEISRDA